MVWRNRKFYSLCSILKPFTFRGQKWHSEDYNYGSKKREFMKYTILIVALSTISWWKITLAAEQQAFIAAILSPTHTDELEVLLAKNPSLANIPLIIKEMGTTSLRLAAIQEKHSLQRVSLLLENKADCNAVLKSPREIHKNRTLLMDIADTPGIVFDRNAQEIFKRCLKEPVDFSLKDIDDATLLDLLTGSAHNPLLDEPYKSQAEELLKITKARKKEQDFFYLDWLKKAQYTLIASCSLDEKYIAAIITQYAEPSVYELHRLMHIRFP